MSTAAVHPGSVPPDVAAALTNELALIRQALVARPQSLTHELFHTLGQIFGLLLGIPVAATMAAIRGFLEGISQGWNQAFASFGL
jgi:hypothetical protein